MIVEKVAADIGRSRSSPAAAASASSCSADDPVTAIRDFFGTRDLQALPLLHRRDERAASSSESCVPVSSHAYAAAHDLDIQRACVEIARLTSVISSSPRGDGLRSAAMSQTLVVVEVQAGHRVVRPRLRAASPRCDSARPLASNSTTP